MIHLLLMVGRMDLLKVTFQCNEVNYKITKNKKAQQEHTMTLTVVGETEGLEEGERVGFADGETVGLEDGDTVGFFDGYMCI